MRVIFLYSILGLLFPAGLGLIGLARLHRLALRRAHDLMLYRLCKVRDEAALLAIGGQLNEEDEMFDFFYTTTARIIHENRHMGVCFSGLMRALDKHLSLSKNGNRQATALKTRIQSGGEKFRELTADWCFAIEIGYMAAFPLIKYDRIVRVIRKIHSEALQAVMDRIGFSKEEQLVYFFCQSLRQSIT